MLSVFGRGGARVFLLLGIAALNTTATAQITEISGVTIENFSSQLPGAVQPCCDRRADYLLNNTGLNINGTGTMTTVPDGSMWLSDENTNIAAQYVTFDLGAVYDLDGTRIWNYNEFFPSPSLIPRGVRQMIVRVSTDNVTYRSLGEVVLNSASDPASAFRDFSQYVPLKVSDVRYVQFDIRSNWGDGSYVGLSKVRFFSAPAAESPVTSGLIMHLDASDTDGDGNPVNQPGYGATVGTWVDKSGQGNNAAASGAPLLLRDNINGHASIRFNGNDHYNLPNFSGLTSGEIFAVVRSDHYPPLNPASTGLWNMGTAGAQTHYSWIDGTIYDSWGTDTRNDGIPPTVPLDQWNIYQAASAPGSWMCALNGVTQRTRASNTVAFPATSVLGRSFGGIFFEGEIAEVLMYNRTLDAAERAQVNGYLSRKYNLSGPYTEPENAPPVTQGITLHYDASTDGQVGNGGVLGRWNDRSGNALHAASVGSPLWVRNSLGGNAAVRFNGTDAQYTLGNLASRFPTGATVFVATTFNDAAYNLFDTANDVDTWWRWNGNGRSFSGSFRAPRAENFDTMPASGEYVFSVESTPSFWRMLQDNQGKAAVGASYSAGNDYRISGGYGVGDKLLGGDISEVIVYDRALSTEKQAQVQAYLGSKYRINTAASNVPITNGRVLHLAADAIPNAADGGVVGSWNDLSASGLTATAGGDPRYRDNRINGKPTVELDGVGDYFDVNVGTSNQMTLFAVARGTSYHSMFRWQPGDYLVYPWGDGRLIQSQNGGTNAAESINAGLVADEWNIAAAVFDTGAANGVKTYRNGVLRAQRTYGAWNNLSPLQIGRYLGNEVEYTVGEIAEIIVYHRALNDDERRQVERYLADKYGMNGKGPGGLEKSNLELWLRADRGVVADVNNLVSEWQDQSGFNRWIYQDVAAQRPDWIPNSQNGLPVLRFNPNSGAADAVEYFKSDGVWPGGTPGSVGASLVFAARSNVNDTFGYQSIIRYQGGTWLISPWYNTVIINEDSGTNGVNNGLVPLQWNLSESLFRANQTNGFQTFNGGSLVAQKNSANIILGANPLLVGACCGNTAVNGESPNADIAEVITYSERLNDARRVLLQNYLSSRLDTALNTNDIYAGDTAGAGHYDWDVAGIGRVGNPADFPAANPQGAGRHMLGNSAGLIIEEIGFLQDSGDFLVAGHNGAPNDLTNDDLVGSGAQHRWGRVWYIDKTDVGSNGGQVRLTFDISDGKPGGLNSGDLVLLRRSGPTGNFAIIANTPTVLGDQYSFVLNANSVTDGYFTVAEVDTAPPVITLSGGDMLIQCGSGYTDPGFTAIDNSDGDITANVVISGATVNPNNPGSYTVRYNVTDTAGNGATERTRIVTVQDTTPPTIMRNGAAVVNVECGTPYIDAGAMAADACDDASLTLAIVTGGLPIATNSTGGPFAVTYNVTDSAGLPATQVTRTVNVVDTTPPTLVVGGSDVTIECGSAFTAPTASATDVCAGVVPVVVTGSVDTGTPGIYQLFYNATDGVNAAPQQIRTITVEDTLGPVISVNGSLNETVVLGQPYVDDGATAEDECEGPVGVIATGTVNTNALGTYFIDYNAVDSGGRPAVEQTRAVTVVAGNPPVITVVGSATVTVECGGSYIDAGATATDVEDNDVTLTANIVVGGLPIPTGVPGSYTVTYNVTDTSGNPASQQSRTVIVEDTVAPQLTLVGQPSVSLTCGAVYNDAGATAQDTCDDDTALTATIVTTGLPVPTGVPGNYVVTYNVTDSEGNQAVQISRTVEVTDTVPPAITLSGNPVVTLECGDTYIDAGATASDFCDDDAALTSAIVVGGLPIDSDDVGQHIITYNVDDVAGNSATQVSRIVIVEDTGAPVINLNGPVLVSVDLNGQYFEQGASASDSCEGDLPVTIGGDVVDTSTAGVYIVTYDAIDSAGNAAVQRVREVVVSEGEGPLVIEQPVSTTANFDDDVEFSVTAVALFPLSYQWFKDGDAIANGVKYSGVTTDTLTLADVESADEGGYTCRVTSQSISVMSVIAQLTVNDPGITQQPVSIVVAPGATAQFTLVAVGSGTLTYQWMRGATALANGGDISGADTPVLAIANADAATDEGGYYCIVAGGEDDPITSDTATLDVGNPAIISHPNSLALPAGSVAEFEVEALGAPPLFYRWRKNGANIASGGRYSGTETNKLTITGIVDADEGVYTCRVVGQNIVESNPATLTVLGPPVITSVLRLPESGAVPVQSPVAFTVLIEAGAAPPVAYQWRRNGIPISNSARISGADTPTLAISTSIVSDSGQYDCIVSNPVDSVTSSAQSLEVGLTFVSQLRPRIAEQNESFTWNVRVEGASGPPVYQWLKSDGSKAFVPLTDIGHISGATTASLSFAPLEYADAGIYRVDVSDGIGTYPSNEAHLQVVESLPVSSIAAFGLAALLSALGGAVLLRRKKGETR